ncbi:MAG TPA: GDP-mannose 4,6-dehydratase [Desulfobacteraceae bacterium]|mgnify:CR=1 FL=1|nr:GDP-mannose 4,6-dehydratase [Desulfobacteraceae bacterium]HPJ68623.1 GDP-mannose 4,6-dehydratase [Desulfobacteraceae bacterium]HPQ27529.1 GDP-mannose 4,6-dehydratase [Desulfobacteraceae bacterium]
MKKALILGISGQDGAYLAEFLLRKGYRVIGCSRDAEMRSFSSLKRMKILDKIEIESVYLGDFRRTLEVLRKILPDEVYNLAGQSSVGLSFDQPVETFQSIGVATLNLLEAVRYLGQPIKIYNAGSGECFGNTGELMANEQTPFHPRSPYAVAKAASTCQFANYRESYGFYACTGILFNHESPLRPIRFVTRKIVNAACRIARGEMNSLELGNIQVERDWGWTPEYVEAMWCMLQQENPEDYIIATGHTRKLEDFVREAFEAVGLDWRDHVKANPSLLRPSDIMTIHADSGKALRNLGWKAHYLMEDVVRMMIEEEMKLLDIQSK